MRKVQEESGKRSLDTGRGDKTENRSMKKADSGSQGGHKGLEKTKDQTESRSKK